MEIFNWFSDARDEYQESLVQNHESHVVGKLNIVLGIAGLIIIGIVSAAVFFVYQTENYMKLNDAWKVQSVQATNNNTTNIMTIGSYLSAQIAREASSTKK